MKFNESSILIKIIKFGMIGSIGLVLDFTITWFLKDIMHLHYLVANAFGFSIATFSNYSLNTIWTFNKKLEMNRKLVLFVLISLTGLAFNTLFLSLILTHFLTNFYLAKLITIVIVFFWNFTANFLITFRKSLQDDKNGSMPKIVEHELKI